MRTRLALVLAALAAAGCGADPLHAPPPDGEGPPTDARLPPFFPAHPTVHLLAAPADPPPPDPPPGPPAGCQQVRVVNTGGDVLNVRPDPSTTNAPVGQLHDGQVVTDVAVVQGQDVGGNATWYQVDAGGGLSGFISAAFSACVDPNAPPPLDGFLLPLACGSSASITQGNNSPYSHNGFASFAFDFGIPRHTPLVAIADGTVIGASDQVQPGDACWNGGGQECANTVNYVLVQHADGNASLYMHLDAPTVNVGDHVVRGEQVGWSGGTGWSTGPHAHMQRQQVCGSWWCQSVETSFTDFGGIPNTGDVVTSQNCP